jgi:hypothetical protein
LANPGVAALARRESICLAHRFSDHAPLIIDYDLELRGNPFEGWDRAVLPGSQPRSARLSAMGCSADTGPVALWGRPTAITGRSRMSDQE